MRATLAVTAAAVLLVLVPSAQGQLNPSGHVQIDTSPRSIVMKAGFTKVVYVMFEGSLECTNGDPPGPLMFELKKADALSTTPKPGEPEHWRATPMNFSVAWDALPTGSFKYSANKSVQVTFTSNVTIEGGYRDAIAVYGSNTQNGTGCSSTGYVWGYGQKDALWVNGSGASMDGSPAPNQTTPRSRLLPGLELPLLIGFALALVFILRKRTSR